MDAVYQILVVFSKNSSAYDTALNTLLGLFEEQKIPAEFYLIHLEHASALELDRWRKHKFRLIFSMGSRASTYLHTHQDEWDTPIVTVCAKDPVLLGLIDSYEPQREGHIAYTSLDVPIATQLTYMRRLLPNLKRIAVLYARGNTSAINTQVVPLKNIVAAHGIEVLDVVLENPSQAKAELAEKVKQTTRILGEQDPELSGSIYWITGSTEVFNEMKTINRFAESVPVLSVTPSLVTGDLNKSAVLSIGASFENNARLAGTYAVRILSVLSEAGELPVGVVMPPDISINFQRVRQIGLKIPFGFLESASFIYDYQGRLVREQGRLVEVNR